MSDRARNVYFLKSTAISESMGGDIRQSGRHLHFFKTPAPSKKITGQCRQSGRKDSHAQTGTFAETALAERADGPGQA